MKKTMAILLTVIIFAALSAPSLASSPPPAPTIARVNYGPLGLDTRFAVYAIIPQSFDAYIASGGLESIELEVMYNEGDGEWRPAYSVVILGSTPPGTMPFNLFHSINAAPWSEFRARLVYNYGTASGGSSPVYSAWSAPKRAVDAPVVTSQGIVFYDYTYGYTVTLPLSWTGLFLINSGSGDRTVFMNKRNQAEVYLGQLFSIAVTDGERPDMPDPVRIASANGKTAWYSIPGGVNYDAGNASLRSEYLAMANDVQAIIRSFRFGTARPTVAASPSSSSVVVNGTPVVIGAYTINNSNYFKLRDLAYILSGTEAQFDVGFNIDFNAISLTSGVPYSTQGAPPTGVGPGIKQAAPNASVIFIDGIVTDLTAYTIDSLNYFMLRDIARAFDFFVTWDNVTDTLVIDTTRGYNG